MIIPKCKVVKFNVMEVLEAVKALKALKSGKGPGLNKLQAEHFTFANVQVFSCLLCVI